MARGQKGFQLEADGRVLLLEGNDELRFFQAAFKPWGLDEKVQRHEWGGERDRLGALLGLISDDPHRATLKALAIVRDAEQSAASELQSVQGHLRKWGFPVPDTVGEWKVQGGLRVGVLLMPGRGRDKGCFEDLLLESVPAGHAAMKCVEGFMECIMALPDKKALPENRGDAPDEAREVYRPKNLSKAKLQAFLAATHENRRLPGEAAQKGVWDFEAPCFQELRRFLAPLKLTDGPPAA